MLIWKLIHFPLLVEIKTAIYMPSSLLCAEIDSGSAKERNGGEEEGCGVREIYIISLSWFKFSWLTFIHLKFTTLCVTDYTMDKSRIEFQGILSRWVTKIELKLITFGYVCALCTYIDSI